MEKEKSKMKSTVLHEEQATIKENVEAAGQTVAAYLLNVGMGDLSQIFIKE